MNNPLLSESPPSYAAATCRVPAPVPPPVAGGAQVVYGSPPPVAGGAAQVAYNGSSSLQQHTTAGPVLYNTGASQAVTYASPKRIFENYNGRQSFGLGVTMILVGLLCIIFNIVTMHAIKHHVAGVGYGIWSGVMFFITGIFGVVVAKKKTMCKIIGFMVLCIVSSVLCPILFLFSIIGADTVKHHTPCYRPYHYGYYGSAEVPTPEYPSACSRATNMEVTIVCLSVIMTICTIWGSVLCCKVVCCCASPGQMLLPVQYISTQGNQQMILYPMQQGVSQGIIIGNDIPSASGGSYNMPDNFPYNPQQYGQRPPIYNEHKVPL